jgi:POTRA domain-containing FtsQ-type protein
MKVLRIAPRARRRRTLEQLRAREWFAWLVATPWRATFFLAIAAMCFTVGPLLRYCKNHRYFAVRAVDVQGGERLDSAQVRVWLGMVEGSSIWDASPGDLEAKLESHPAIARARVRRLFPDRILVTVKEREPRAILRTDSGAFFVDRAGVVLGEAALEGGDLPILTLSAIAPGEARDDVHASAPPAKAAGKGAASAVKAAGAARSVGAAASATPAAAAAPSPPAAPAPLPSAAELRRAVQVAQWLEKGEGGVGLSELTLKPGQPHPELVAFSSDGKLSIRLGWGDWRDKLTALRLVIASASRSLAGNAGAPHAPSAASQLAGTIDVHDPAAVIVRWAHPGGAA